MPEVPPPPKEAVPEKKVPKKPEAPPAEGIYPCVSGHAFGRGWGGWGGC